MDGNNRWSIKRKINLFDSYLVGSKKLLSISNYIFSNYETKYITSFALSKNNLNRPSEKLKTLIKVLEYFVDDKHKLNEFKFNILIKGNFSFLNRKLIKKINQLNLDNKNYSKSLIILLNYSGQDEIYDSVKQIVKNKEKVNKNNFEKNLLLSGIPNPDMLIRTGGYNRISNFMLWQLAYAELYFTETLWPDFKKENFFEAILNYQNRERRFGKTSEQISENE